MLGHSSSSVFCKIRDNVTTNDLTYFCFEVYLQGRFPEVGLLSEKTYAYVLLLHIAKYFSIKVVVIHIPPGMYETFCFPKTSVCCQAFEFFANLMGEKWYLIIALICIPLTMSEVKYLSCLRTIFISFFHDFEFAHAFF